MASVAFDGMQILGRNGVLCLLSVTGGSKTGELHAHCTLARVRRLVEPHLANPEALCDVTDADGVPYWRTSGPRANTFA